MGLSVSLFQSNIKSQPEKGLESVHMNKSDGAIDNNHSIFNSRNVKF